MAFYIVQHGLSLPKEQDPEKGLAPQGIEDVKRIAEVARNYRVPVERILHSQKKRARQTAELIGEVLQPAQVNFKANTMVVGHLPFLERLTSFLITGRQDPILFKLQNGGIVCLDRIESSDTPAIKWALMPRVD